MSVNAREEEYERVELYGKPALFTNFRIDRDTVPEGFYCYDLRGSDRDPGKPATLENLVIVNYSGTVLTSDPVTIPKEGFRRLYGGLNFLAESLTLSGFCEKYNFKLPPDNRKFILRPASPDEADLFFALPKERDKELGTVGYVRIDFGGEGKEFWHTWWPRGDEALNSPEFKAELTELVNELRETGPLKSLTTMSSYCGKHGGQIEGGWRQNYGYIIETEHYRYCLRCNPGPGDYQAYLIAFDKQTQNMNMQQKAPAQEGGLTEVGKQMLQNAADNSLPHSYGWFVIRNFSTPDEKLTGDLTLPDAIRLYNETDSGNKRLGVMKDKIATVDFVITLNGEQHFTDDYTKLASFSDDPKIADAVESLKKEIDGQNPVQGITM